jgi:hypothetical protein
MFLNLKWKEQSKDDGIHNKSHEFFGRRKYLISYINSEQIKMIDYC